MWKTWSGVADRVYLNDLLISLISFDVCVSAKIHGNVNVNFDFNRIDALFSSRSYSERKNLNNFALKLKMWKKKSLISESSRKKTRSCLWNEKHLVYHVYLSGILWFMWIFSSAEKRENDTKKKSRLTK